MAVSRSVVVLVALCASFLSPPPVGAQEKLSSEKLSQESQAAADVREQKIREEVKSLKDHPWAGEYYFGDGLGVNVRLLAAPKAGFVFTWNGCLGLYDLNYGEVEETNGRIRLMFKYPNSRKGFQGLAPELLPIRWGQRHYLIPSDEMVKFANEVNAGTEPNRSLGGGRSYYFLLRVGDEKKKARGMPPLPPESRAYLLKSPIRAGISSIVESHVANECRVTAVILDVGSAKGLRSGMTLHVYSPSQVSESATVTRVTADSAEAEIVQWDTASAPPSTEWKLSTKLL